MSDNQEQAGFVAPDPADLAPLFPGYEIQGLIATGGMGAVYRALQKSLDRTVALKILPRELSKDAAFCAGFEAEAKAMARLNHPNLIGVYDFGEVNGMLYIIMEYVPGKSLYHSAYGKSIAPKEVIRLVTGICKGLAHAHENGILHRDIKPSNILLDHNAEPKIGDFGLARPIGTKVEEGEEIFGTPHYTAPEVVNSPHSVDYRADIFSVGVLLHELLTGRLPAADSRPASMIAQCDVRFDTIIRKATQPLAAARYSSATEIANELQAIASALGPKGPPRAPGGPANRSIKPVRPAKGAHPKGGYPRAGSRKSSNSGLVFFLLVLVTAAAAAYFFYPRVSSVEPVKKPTIIEFPPTSSHSDTGHKSPDDQESSPEPRDNSNASNRPPREDTEGVPEPDGRPDIEENTALPPPKADIPGLFERARKVLRERAKPAISAYQVGLKDNFASFEHALRRQVAKYKPGLGPDSGTVNGAIEEWRTDNGSIPESLGETLSAFSEIAQIREEFAQRQVGVQDTFKQALSQLSSSYLQGLQKQIELRKAENDPGAVDLIEKEIAATKGDVEYFPGLILGATPANGE